MGNTWSELKNTRKLPQVLVGRSLTPLHDVVARLKPGFTPEQAASEAEARVNVPIPDLRPRARLEFIGGDGVAHIQAMPLIDWAVREVKPALWVMFAAVALLFAAAIGNVANMQFARAAARQQEVENDARIRLLTGVLEPALILAMGALVLLIVLAILLPIIEMNQLVRLGV